MMGIVRAALAVAVTAGTIHLSGVDRATFELPLFLLTVLVSDEKTDSDMGSFPSEAPARSTCASVTTMPCIAI